MIANKTYYIDQINSTKANQFTSAYHYSGTGFKKAKINLGIFRNSDNLMVGCLQWGCSAQEGIRLDRYVKEPITTKEYLELNRFCMADSEGKNSESQAISLGLQWIKRNCPEIRLLVSYAGRKEGNYGYIYQATNWEYLGYFISDGFWLLDGEERHQITVWYRYKKYGNPDLSFRDGICALYDDVRQTWTKQFIYIQRLDKSLTPASPILPYPKPSNEYPIMVREEIYKGGGEITYKVNDKKPPIYYYEKDKYLFSKQALQRRGEYIPPHNIYALYNAEGTLYSIYSSLEEAAVDVGGSVSSARKVINTEKSYRRYFWRVFQAPPEPDIPEVIDIQYLCIIDDIHFLKQVDVAAYCGVTKQAISYAKQKQAKTIGGKPVEWYHGTI